MERITTQLLDKKIIAKGTMAFYFNKPANFTFSAGQYTNIKLINPPHRDEKGISREFSIASAPYEEHIMIATRMRNSAFKNDLQELPEGSDVLMKTAGGAFILRENQRGAVFLAGGIGITPFRSIILDAQQKQLPTKMHLFYSNHSPEDAAFHTELSQIKNNPNFEYVPIMTQMNGGDWHGETEHISFALIQKYVKDLNKVDFYIAGPPQMVLQIRDVLLKSNIQKESIIFETFSGY